MQCQAKNKKTGDQCRRRAVTGKRVCWVHGGASLSGIASPSYRTGRYSKVLPARLAPRYEEAQQDAQLLELREDISLLDARLADLLSRVDTGESGALWASLQKARLELIAAKRGRDEVGQATALNTMVDLIGQGHADYRAWGELAAVLEQRKRLVESERKRLIETQQVITSQQAMLLVTALLESIKRNVTDHAQLEAVQADFIRIISLNDQHVVD